MWFSYVLHLPRCECSVQTILAPVMQQRLCKLIWEQQIVKIKIHISCIAVILQYALLHVPQECISMEVARMEYMMVLLPLTRVRKSLLDGVFLCAQHALTFQPMLLTLDLEQDPPPIVHGDAILVFLQATDHAASVPQEHTPTQAECAPHALMPQRMPLTLDTD